MAQRQQVVCGAGVSHPGESQQQGDQSGALAQLSTPVTGMAKGLGSFSGGATLQRSKLSQKQEVKEVIRQTDNSGGGGNNGKNIFNGGGGDGGDGDDDDYTDDFGDDDGEGGDESFFRTVMKQLYDEKSLKAVLSEWYRSVGDLPAIIRQSVEMGIFSSAQLVRFLAMDVRPNITRAVTRSLPPMVSRGVVGRLMADPAFVQKMLMEQLITIGSSLYWEVRQRGENFHKELDFVAINTLSLAAATGAMVWMVSPNRSYGAVHKQPWQNMLHNLPNHVFDASTPHRQFSMQTRAAGLLAKTAELCAVGMISGAAMSGLSQAALALRRRALGADYQPSVRIPDVRTSACGLAVSTGIFTNLRYQMIGGVDRYLFDHSNFLWSYLAASGIVRVISNRIGEPTRLHLQGLPSTSPQQEQQRARPLPQPRATITVEAQKPLKPRTKKRSAGGTKKQRSRGFEMSAGLQPAGAQ
ncbi:hypothetical protein WJX72_003527 [[Myrmecia] bisecta]|uniref:Uncharacterized protein n=1 Tax=[Myrmecia] bisecta TaxID=41462 RepID=A0AAW1Q3U1_9CHLO